MVYNANFVSINRRYVVNNKSSYWLNFLNNEMVLSFVRNKTNLHQYTKTSCILFSNDCGLY